MPLLTMAVKHGRTFDDAKGRLELAVSEVRTRFGPLVQAVEWSPERDAATLTGTGFRLHLRVDATEVHVEGDLPLLGGLLGGPLASRLKAVVQGVFQKKLT